MAKSPRGGSTRLPAAKLLGTVRRGRAGLMVTTALQAAFVMVLAVPATTPARAQPAPNARPIGGQVVAGSASISQAPNVTTVTQSSQRAAVNWRSFDVGAQQTVQFDQPSASAATLNRVTGPNPSQIAGRIDANGQVILVNQDGVTFYKGAQVNAAGLVVSAAGISNRNFMAGRMVFDRPAHPNARVENQGNITVRQAGLAALVAPQVANSGVITAKLGHVVLAGARAATLDLYGDGLVSIDVTRQVEQVPVGPDGKTATALVTNTGTVLANGGTVQLTAQAVDGIVQNLVTAGGRISAASVGGKTGEIDISGIGGSITVAGQLAAQGVAAGTSGGRIKVVADGGVTLARTAVLNASGRSGGGTVAVGTTLARARGGPSVKAKMTASSVTVDAGAQIFADAIGNGNGGRVVVLSTGTTQVDGAIEAKAGSIGGNGGFVELSGQTLGLTGGIDVSARGGATGTILLDPGTLDIVHSTSSDGSLDDSFSGSTLPYDAGGTTGAGTVTDHEIELIGSKGNVVLQATTLLDVQTSLSVANGLTMQSGGDLVVGPALSIQAGTTLLLGSGIVFPAGTVGAAGAISLGAGDRLIAPSIILQGGSTGIALNNALLSASSSLDISAAGGGVTELNTGTISTPFLTSSNGIVGTASLMAPTNSISALGGITVTDGNFDLEDAAPLSVDGRIVAGNGNILVQEGTGSALALNQGLFAAPTGTISVVADAIAVGDDGAIAAVGFGHVALVEIAPASTTTAVVMNSSAGLGLDTDLFDIIQTGTLRIGAFTQPGGSLVVTAPSISFDSGLINLRTGTIAVAVALDLEANGSIDQPSSSTLSVGTLTGSTNGAAGSSFLMRGAGNDIDALGNVSVADGNFLLNDSAALTVVGAVSAGTPAAPNSSNTASISIGTGGTLAIGATGLPGSLNAGVVALVAQDTISEPNGSVGANTLAAQSSLGSVLLNGGMDQISTIAAVSAAGNIEIVADPTVLTLTGTESGDTLFFENRAVGGTIALNAANLTAMGSAPVVSLVADHLTQPAPSTIAATAIGLVQLAPANASADVTLGGTADTLGAALSAITPATGTLEIGGFTGTDGVGTITAHSITIAEPLNLSTLAGTLALESNGAVTQGVGDSLTNVGVLVGSAASFALLDGGNQISTIAGLSATGSIAVVSTPAAIDGPVPLTLTGTETGTTLFFENPAVGGTIALNAATLTAFGTAAVVSLVADSLTQPAPSTIDATTAGLVQLAPANATTDVTVGGTADTLGAVLSAITPVTGTLEIGGFTGTDGVGTITANSITIDEPLNLSTLAGTLALESNGAVTQGAGDSLINLGTLVGSAGSFALLDGGNQISTIAGLRATGSIAVVSTPAVIDDPVPLTLTGTETGTTLFFENPAVGGTIALNAATLTAFGTAPVVSLIADNLTQPAPSTIDATATGLVQLAPANATTDVTVGGTADTLGAVLSAITPATGTLEIGGFTGTDGLGTITANSITIAAPLNLSTLAGTLALESNGAVTQGAGDSLTNLGTLVGSAGSFALLDGGNQISTIAGLSADGSIEIVADPTVLTLTGNESGVSLFFENPSVGGTIALDAATLTATGDTPVVSLVADHLTQPAPSTIDATATGLVQLAPANATADVTVGGTADTLGAVLSAITPVTGALEIGGFTGTDGLGTITANSITIAAPLNLGTLAGTLALESNGAVTQGAGDSLTNVGVLVGSAESFALLDGGNQIDQIRNLTASGTAGIAVADANALTVNGRVSALAGQIYLQSSNAGGVTLGPRATLAGGTLDSIEANAFTIAGDGTVLAGPVFELAPLSGTMTLGVSVLDLSLASLRGIGPDVLRLGAVTLPGDVTPTTTAGSIEVAGTFGSTAISLELDSSGGITEAAPLIAGTLSGTAGGAALLTAANTIDTLASFAADGFTLNDTVPLMVTGAVAGGPSASIVDTGLLTVAGTGAVTASTIALNSGSIEIDGMVSDGGAGTTSLIATDGFINEPGTLISGTLSGNASLFASLTGTNMIGTLGAFSASGFMLDDSVPLMVTGAVAGGPYALIDDTGQLLTVAGTGSVGADAIDLAAGSIEIDGLLSDSGTTTLVATGGTINETGTVLAGTLTASAPGDILLANPANMVSTSAGLVSTNGDVVLVDGENLTLTGAQSGNNLFFEVAAKGGTLTLSDAFIGDRYEPTPATLTAASGGRISLVADNYLVQPNPVTGVTDSTITAPAGTLELAPYPPSMTTVSTSLLQDSGLLAIVNFGTTVLNELVVGGFTDVPAGATGSTPSAAGITIDATFNLAPLATTLDLEATGSVSQSAPVINVGTLLGTTGSTALTNPDNTVAVLGNYTAGNGFSLTDAGSLNIAGSVVAGPSASFTVAGSLTESGSLTSDVLSGSAAASAALTGNNSVAQLNGFAVSGTAGNFVLNDTGNLLIDGVLNATRIVVSDPSSQVSFGNGATVVTGGNTRPTGPTPPPSLLPANGAAGAYFQVGSFSQTGSSTLLGQGGGPATLQIAATGNMQFDPSLGLQATGGWLILNLTNGSAAGNAFVGALDVSYTTPGSTNLSGTIRGIAGGPAAAAGFIQPAININYLFNGCEIGAAVCRPVPPPPPPPPPPPHVPPPPIKPPPPPITPTVIGLPNDALTVPFGGLYLFRFLSGAPPQLTSLTSLNLFALPMLASPPGRLTDPDVVPPNISYKDY